ncbi:MAG: cadmium-translocating P-type ATPase, partial [Firmicutes bacterium]|nr:cadmium-translocating P-type ATPase [Bacillota bacterium]
MTKSQKKDLVKILISAALFIIAELVPKAWPLFLVSYAIVGYGPIFSAVKNISRGQIFDENFLMTRATAGALALRQWDEAVAVMLFYAVGELFEDYAVNRSRNSIKDLMDIRPDYAVKLTDGAEGTIEETVDPYDVMPGDIIIVKPGEKVPLDGIVIDGTGSLDTSALTGESLPKDISPGMEITSGFVNLTGLLKIKVTSPFEESTVSKILDLVENSGSRKAKVEKFITRFARYYTPAVVFAAIALAIIPPLLFNGQWQDWIYRALLFLVISCPCALVISVPLAFFGGVGTASRYGILVKGSNYMEALASVSEIVFDKTGTITTGNFEVTNSSSPELLELAAHIESYSAHPISQSIIKAYGREPDKVRVGEVKEIPGEGICAEVDGRKYYAGNDKLMTRIGAT